MFLQLFQRKVLQRKYISLFQGYNIGDFCHIREMSFSRTMDMWAHTSLLAPKSVSLGTLWCLLFHATFEQQNPSLAVWCILCTKFSNFLGGKAAEKEDVDQSLFIALDQKEPCVYVCARLRSFHTFQFQKDRKRNEPFFPYYSKAKKKMATKKYLQSQRKNPIFHFLNCTVRIFSEEKFWCWRKIRLHFPYIFDVFDSVVIIALLRTIHKNVYAE